MALDLDGLFESHRSRSSVNHDGTGGSKWNNSRIVIGVSCWEDEYEDDGGDDNFNNVSYFFQERRR